MENNETVKYPKYPAELDKLGEFIRNIGLDTCVGWEMSRLGIPVCGIAKTIEGEILRATMKIRYRCFNDGDKFFKGYGAETAGPSASFLIWLLENKLVPEAGYSSIVDELDQAENAATDDDYESAIEECMFYTLLYTMSIPTEKLKENSGGLDNLDTKVISHWWSARNEEDFEEEDEFYEE